MGDVGVANQRAEPGARTAVLFVHTATMPPLGADTWVHAQIASRLDPARYDVHVACAGTASHPTPTYEVMDRIPDVHLVAADLGTERYASSARRGRRPATELASAVASMARLTRHVRRHRIAIVHTSDRPRDAVATVVLARLTGARSIVHCHVGYDPRWMGRPLRWAIARADVRIAVSEYVASTLVAAGHDPTTTHVVLNAIDVDRWTPGLGRCESRAELGLPDEAPVVITVCRLFPSKGPGDLIRALARLSGTQPDVRLLVVGNDMSGDGSFSRELGDLARSLGVEDRVTFLGRRSDVDRLMAAADVFAMPSTGEPFGLVYLEAMAMGLPVVALDSGGAPEVVDHGDSGLLSEPGDIDGLTAHLATLLGDPPRRARMGEHGRRRVYERFTIERMARDTEAVYRRITRRAGGPQEQTPSKEEASRDDDHVRS